ncbi:TetR/AcrR family transcriptional regulator C-terminal domain-containing protein [Archangium lansingense]|uniref:TetR/AcrR family transcriptional regulator C-terminal domain-containing protein n=1 Tax=Archangium lansingense TaxID=2995310 RepID=A0ABT4AF16_9BACT|nr:TetR/AcrR family transcriptional regulator C-terminal domain-containing protein [Archangium lansinium]MCY1080255.1 TetR/AcrR family transcriptional regulator C-terminal domain-containing protein [Archangium lansinium]
MATRLDRERVVGTALRVLNEVGLEGLTLRRIASELNVQAPALYWHFKNKQELLDEMATAMLRDLVKAERPAGQARGWRELMAEIARGLRRMLLGYRDGAKVFSGTRLTDPSLYASLDAMLRQFVEAGFSLRDAVSGYSTVYNYTVGFTIEEQAVYPMPGERKAQYDLARRAKRMEGQGVPLAQAMGEELFTGFDDRFERGLELILNGIEQSLPHRR